MSRSSRKTAKATEVWRFQRDSIYPDVVTGMTKDRKRWVFITSRQHRVQFLEWQARFGRRMTIYAVAIVGMSVHRPSVSIVREVDGW